VRVGHAGSVPLAGCRSRNLAVEVARATDELRGRLDATGLIDAISPKHFHPTVAASRLAWLGGKGWHPGVSVRAPVRPSLGTGFAQPAA
jgi:hypothetical protein